MIHLISFLIPIFVILFFSIILISSMRYDLLRIKHPSLARTYTIYAIVFIAIATLLALGFLIYAFIITSNATVAG